MSRIDDALRRLTGQSADLPKPSVVRRFVLDSEPRAGERVGGQSQDRWFDARLPGAARQAPRVPPAREIATPRASRRATSKAEATALHPSDRVLDVRQIVYYAGFACRAVLRHKVLMVVSFIMAFAMTVTATFLAPKTYDVEVKLLAQRSAIIASLSNPGRAIPYDADAPTRAAAEMILRRDNVISLIRQTDLINEWDRTRAPILRFADRVRAQILRHEPTLDDRLDNLVSQIEKRMAVTAGQSGDGLVKIDLAWPDAHSGYLLVEHAQQAFLAARQVAETQAIAEAITILERYAQSLSKDIQATLAELSRTQARVLSEYPAAPTPSNPTSIIERALQTPDPLASLAPASEDFAVDPLVLADPRLGRLRNTIAAKRGELGRLEEEQKRKLSDLEGQLSVARTIYTPNHPTVQSLQQNVSTLQRNSPQIMLLRNELDRLELQSDEQAAAEAERLIRAELGRRGATPAPRGPRSAPVAAAPTPTPTTVTPRRDAVAEFATLRLRTELNQLRNVLERTDGARIELAVSQAAFKHRYSVVQPATEPGEQSFPDTRRVLIAGLLSSILFALISAVAADIMSDRILEPWQVQRQLGLLVLGRVRVS
jgi:uncharacterized protein involved in exopolysaccharide biosynthesis